MKRCRLFLAKRLIASDSLPAMPISRCAVRKPSIVRPDGRGDSSRAADVLLAPVCELRGDLRIRPPQPLPARKIGVLNRERRERRCRPAEKASYRAVSLDQHAERPAVADCLRCRVMSRRCSLPRPGAAGEPAKVGLGEVEGMKRLFLTRRWAAVAILIPAIHADPRTAGARPTPLQRLRTCRSSSTAKVVRRMSWRRTISRCSARGPPRR